MKKKILKNLFVLLMAAMVIAAGIQATAATMAVENGTVDFGRGDAQITIQGNEGQSLNGKKFNLYKLFDAENADGLESINYTFNPDFKSALQTVVGEKLQKEAVSVTEYEVIDYIQSLNNNKVEGAQVQQTKEGRYSDFRYFIEALRDEIVQEGGAGDVITVTSTNANNAFVIAGLEYGYYIVDEIMTVSNTYQAASLCIVNTANPNASVNIKSDYPSVVKKIQEDDNKVSIGNDGWNDIADFEIGQTVPYKVESFIPNINGYDTYYYAWHDVMDEALTFNPDTVKIEINDGEKTYVLGASEYKVILSPNNSETFMIEVSDMKEIVDSEFDNINDLNENVYEQKVILTYTATLNENAAKDMGRAGYENDVCLEFSNNPDTDGENQTGLTPWDTVVCFTYQIDVLKTNNHNKELEGAKFRLYSDEACTQEVYVRKADNGYIVINRDSVSETEIPSDAVEMVSGENGSIIVNGVDSGTYYLKETKAPTGYRKLLDPIKVTISTTYSEDRNVYVKGDGATNKTLKSLVATAHIKKFLDGAYSDEGITLVTNVETGTVNLTVINDVGSKLPVTGSAATILMLAAGAGLMLFFVFTKKKETSEES